jgi:hypothetical protein
MDESKHIVAGYWQLLRHAISAVSQLIAAFRSDDIVKGMSEGIDGIDNEGYKTFLLVAFTEIFFAGAFCDVFNLWFKFALVTLLPELNL